MSPVALALCVVLYVLRAFGITAGYHRYFSHRSFETSRWGQLALAALGASAAQLGPLWWAGHHRLHHRHADTPQDVHSPTVRGFWWAHMGWLLCSRYSAAPVHAVPDLAARAELRWIDRYHFVAPLALGLSLFGLGALLQRHSPGLGTSGPQLISWGFFVSTVALYHATYAANSVGHCFGRRNFATPDTSRNSWPLALLMLGDGWHNNHHRFPSSARHGLGGWEFDPTHAALRALRALGFVWKLREPPHLKSRDQSEGSQAVAYGTADAPSRSPSHARPRLPKMRSASRRWSSAEAAPGSSRRSAPPSRTASS